MEEKKIVNAGKMRDWCKPAHPAIIKLHNDLISIYTHIREKYQKEIDNAFDRVSKQIGLVVTTTVPVVLETGEKGAVKGISVGAERLKGSLLDQELSKALKAIVQDQEPDGEPADILKLSGNNSYRLQLVWLDALIMGAQDPDADPNRSHILGFRMGAQDPDADPNRSRLEEDVMLISAIDKVYPELRLRIGWRPTEISVR
jgi:hypothetical protein